MEILPLPHSKLRMRPEEGTVKSQLECGILRVSQMQMFV